MARLRLKLSELAPGEQFVTCLTGRIGTVIGRDGEAVAVAIERTDSHDTATKKLCPDVLVEVEE